MPCNLPRIAVCSLYQYTHVCEFVDVAEQLSRNYDVRYFLGFNSPETQQLLADRGLPGTIVISNRSHQSLLPANRASSARHLFKEYFLHYAEIVTGALVELLSEWRPSLVLCHLRDYAGMNAAEKLNLPMISFGSHTSPARDRLLDPPFGSGIAIDAGERVRQLMWRLQQKFDADIDACHNLRIRQPLGLPALRGASTHHSSRSTILSTIPEFCNKSAPEPEYVKYVGRVYGPSAHRSRPSDGAFLDRVYASPRPRVLISLGTTYIVPNLTRCLDALVDFPGTVVAVTGFSDEIPIVDTRALLCAFIGEMDRLVSLVDFVVSVAGAKTVLDAVSQGKPLLCLPQQGEQREIAQMLSHRNAARMPCLNKWDAGEFVRDAMEILGDKRYAQAARKLQDQVETYGGIAAAVDCVEAEMNDILKHASEQAFP